MTIITNELSYQQQADVNAIQVQGLKLDLARCNIALSLYQVGRTLWPDAPDYQTSFTAAPSWVRERLLRLADEAIGSVNEATEREAVRLAECSLDDLLNVIERDAFELDRNHSRRNLIEDYQGRFRRMLQREKPIAAALSVYRQALTGARR